MSVDIFHLDWVFIDTIIILLLILLLLGVKIYKKTHRWRSYFSNENLEFFSYSNEEKERNNHVFKIKKCELIINDVLKEKKKYLPLIIVINTTFKKKLTNILIEGLGSYGFSVINLKLKIRHISIHKLLYNDKKKELYSLILDILSFFKNKSLTEKCNYILLDFINPHIPFDLIFSDNNNNGVILINPKLNKLNLRDYEDFLHYFNFDSRLFTIFSKSSIFLLMNKNLKNFMDNVNSQKENSKKLLVLEKAHNTFKYYETILLGIIIDIIEKNIRNSI